MKQVEPTLFKPTNGKKLITLLKEDGTEWMTFNGIVSKTDDETLGKINTKISNSDFTNAYDVKIEID